MLSAVLSALFLNDTVCLMLTVPVLASCAGPACRAAPYLIALAMSANIGSVMTEIGNPQNMLIGNYSGWSYGRFLLWMAPVGVVCLAALVAILLWFYGHRCELRSGATRRSLENPASRRADRRSEAARENRWS